MVYLRKDGEINLCLIESRNKTGLSESLCRAVYRMGEKRPFVVPMVGVAASPGSCIASPADTILANSTTGSIGIGGLPGNAEGGLENRLDVTFDGGTTSPLLGSPLPRSRFR